MSSSATTSPTSDVDRLRRKIQQGWAQMENGAGGGEGASDIRSAPLPLDDNLLDEGSELEKLSRQLSYQTELNNALLKQVHDLELEHLAFQKDAQEKKVQLRQALSVAEQSRGDMLDMKRKLALATEQKNEAQEETNRARVEAGIKQRELEQVLGQTEEVRLDMSRMRQERDDCKRDAERAIREQKQMRDELTRLQEDEAVRAAERRADIDAISKEASTVKSRLGPLEAELRAERNRSQELTEALREQTDEVKSVQQQMAEMKSTLQHFKDRSDRAAASEKELMDELDAKTKQVTQAEAQVQAASDLVAAMEGELREVQRQRTELATQKRELENELRDCKLQLEAVANDLHGQAVARKADRERLEQRIAQLQTDLDATSHESRSLGRSLAEENSRREQEFGDQRRALEESKARLQNEVARLNELLLGVQREHAAQQSDFQKERDAYEMRLADLVRSQRTSEAQLSSRDLTAAEELNKLREKLLEAQQQLAQRTRLHVETLGALEGTIHKLANECQRLQAAHDGLLDEVGLMRAAMRDYAERGNTPLEEWHGESRRAMVSMMEAFENAEQEARDAREQQVQAETQRDEERNRTFMLEEERSRLEDELRALEERYRLVEQSSAEKVRQARAEADTAIAARADIESLARRVQDQLDRANTYNRTVQEDLERSQMGLSEAQTRAREKMAQMEDRVAKCEAAVMKAEAERDSALAELQLVKKKLDAQLQEISNLNKDLRGHEEEKRGSALKDSREVADYQKKFAMLSENMRKQSTQLAQTKSLLQVTQEQKKHLQDENTGLKAELHEMMSRTLYATAKDAGVQLLEEGGHGDHADGGVDEVSVSSPNSQQMM